ncbi:hypothetical protein D3C76_1065110 [compost metagenome]
MPPVNRRAPGGRTGRPGCRRARAIAKRLRVNSATGCMPLLRPRRVPTCICAEAAVKGWAYGVPSKPRFQLHGPCAAPIAPLSPQVSEAFGLRTMARFQPVVVGCHRPEAERLSDTNCITASIDADCSRDPLLSYPRRNPASNGRLFKHY